MDLEAFLKETSRQSEESFQKQRRILSFAQFMEAFAADPGRLGRNAAQYVLDAFEYYGMEEIQGVGRKERRFKLFDAPFEAGQDKLIGHEEAQRQFHELLKRFAATGRADRLVLLHGPNGSGKTTLIELVFRALEHYSTLDEGMLFRFNWIFTERLEGKGHMGFGGGKGELPKDTLAFIDENLISCKIPCELRENPIFLFPAPERAKLLDRLAAQAGDARRREIVKGSYLREGGLSAKSKSIFDALLNAYRGDWLKVVRHVQVERYFISRRYRVGAAAIEPQQSVDASARPMNFDNGVALPPVLQGLPLWELSGELVEASGGMVEFSDILKRPLEMNKYLLTTCERGTISLHGNLAHLNVVMIGTCNEKYLTAFKANPDFTSFKGRIELVRVGYQLDWRREREIYRDFLEEIRGPRHLAPYALDVAALWAVMTRLRRPDPSNYPGELTEVIRGLTPLEKARLYGEGRTPDDLNTEEKRLLLATVGQLREEHAESVQEFEKFEDAAYEGRRGASAREMLALLTDAASRPNYTCLSALAIADAMRNLLKDKTVYDFLRLDSDEGYHDCDAFIEEVLDEYFRWVSVVLYDSMDLVEESEFGKRVEEYFRHVRAYVSDEKIENPRTGKFEPPSAETMSGLEKLMELKEPADGFRRNLVSKVAAYSLDHTGGKLPYHEIFPDLFTHLRDSYYRERQKPLETLARYILASGTEDDGLVPAAERPRVAKTLKVMREKYGFCDHCSKETISFVLRRLRE